MHLSPVKHSYAWLPRKCDYRTDRHTVGQTDAGQSDPYMELCFTCDTKTRNLLSNFLSLDLYQNLGVNKIMLHPKIKWSLPHNVYKQWCQYSHVTAMPRMVSGHTFAPTLDHYKFTFMMHPFGYCVFSSLIQCSSWISQPTLPSLCIFWSIAGQACQCMTLYVFFEIFHTYLL